jgi:hypothetical protein
VNKLTKTQREQLIGVAIGTVVIMAGLWYVGVTAKQDELSKTEKNTAQMLDTLKKAETIIRKGDEEQQKMEISSKLLDKREALLASPPPYDYAWIITTIDDFMKPRKAGVNISSFSKAEVSDAGIFPSFPYKWATFHLGGSGYYHDLGAFFADLENQFPCFRVQNLELSANNTVGVEPERLSVSFDLVVPVKAGETK